MMDATRVAREDTVGEIWPALPYEEWKDTLDTLHMWTQIVGKVKLELSPFLNEWWNVALYPTARGLTAFTIPGSSGARHRVFQVDFDFVDHRLDIPANDGSSRSLLLLPRSVADFYHEFMAALRELGLHVQITTTPQEVEDTTPFDQDQDHASYDPEYVTRWWRIILQTDRLLQVHRTTFVGKSSPVLFWRGSFDVSENRFSGRPAPERESPTRDGSRRVSGTGRRRILARERSCTGAGLLRLYLPGASGMPGGNHSARCRHLPPRSQRVYPALRGGQNLQLSRADDPGILPEHLRGRGHAGRMGSSCPRTTGSPAPADRSWTMIMCPSWTPRREIGTSCHLIHGRVEVQLEEDDPDGCSKLFPRYSPAVP